MFKIQDAGVAVGPTRSGPEQAGMLDEFELSIATDAHTPAIDALRQRAYAAAGYFSLPDPGTVRRRTDPRESICLVVARKADLAATVRVTYAADRGRAEAILEGAAEVPQSYFPTVTLCRGATDPSFRGLGLMSFLVSIGVRIASEAGLGSAVGVQFDGTPHFAAMSAAGWNRRPIADRMATVQGNAPLSLVYIGRERFAFSVEHSARVHGLLHKRLAVGEVVRQAVRQIDKLRAYRHTA